MHRIGNGFESRQRPVGPVEGETSGGGERWDDECPCDMRRKARLGKKQAKYERVKEIKTERHQERNKENQI